MALDTFKGEYRHFFSMKFSNLLEDDLTRRSGIMFVATTTAGLLSYIYQIYMGRALGPEQFGVFGALFAIFYMMGIISQTVGTSITQFTSQLIGEGKSIGFFIKGSLLRAAALGLLMTLIFASLSNTIASVLKINGIEALLVLAVVFFLLWIQAVLGGALRGLKYFPQLGVAHVSNALLKLLGGVALVVLGFGVAGAIAGMVIGMLFGFILSLIFLRKHFSSSNPEEPFDYSRIYTYSFPVMLAMFCYSVPANVDVILAKYFFTAEQAGYYTSASVLGKIIFFFPAAIYVVMFPMIAEKHIKGEDTMPLLKKSLAYTFLLIAPLVALYLIFPHIAIKVFGSSYIPAIPLIGPYGLAIFFFSLSVIIMYYHLAIKNMRYIAFFIAFTVAEILMLAIFHASPLQMATVLMAANGVLLGVSGGYTLRFNSILKRMEPAR